MNGSAIVAANTRVLRDFAQVARSGRFRVALVLSLIAHLVLLAVIGRGWLARESGSERPPPLMRVRLLPDDTLAGR